jgi:hypothetical protein
VNDVAVGRAGVEALRRVATVDNLRQADNQLVLRTDSPAMAKDELKELFVANGWRPLAGGEGQAAGTALGDAGKAWDVTVEKAAPRAAPAKAGAAFVPGVFWLAHTNGEDTYIVVADRDSLSRFSTQLAQANRVTVGDDSSRQFRAVASLQYQLRQMNRELPSPQVAAAHEPAAEAAGNLRTAPPPSATTQSKAPASSALARKAEKTDEGRLLEAPAAAQVAAKPEAAAQTWSGTAQKMEAPAQIGRESVIAKQAAVQAKTAGPRDGQMAFDHWQVLQLPANQVLLVIRVRPDGRAAEASQDAPDRAKVAPAGK